jgi:hypothetical protein
MILFREPADVLAFEPLYNRFLGLIEAMPSIDKRQVTHITASPQGAPAYYRILEIYYRSETAMRASLMSPSGQESARCLQELPAGSFDLLLAEVYEEAGGATPQP